jgi:hypothetical protein
MIKLVLVQSYEDAFINGPSLEPKAMAHSSLISNRI